jgi:hypothetical protein
LVKIVIDASDEEANREWMREYKARWKEKFEQLVFVACQLYD